MASLPCSLHMLACDSLTSLQSAGWKSSATAIRANRKGRQFLLTFLTFQLRYFITNITRSAKPPRTMPTWPLAFWPTLEIKARQDSGLKRKPKTWYDMKRHAQRVLSCRLLVFPAKAVAMQQKLAESNRMKTPGSFLLFLQTTFSLLSFFFVHTTTGPSRFPVPHTIKVVALGHDNKTVIQARLYKIGPIGVK